VRRRAGTPAGMKGLREEVGEVGSSSPRFAKCVVYLVSCIYHGTIHQARYIYTYNRACRAHCLNMRRRARRHMRRTSYLIRKISLRLIPRGLDCDGVTRQRVGLTS
jgi:hypothetical protein